MPRTAVVRSWWSRLGLAAGSAVAAVLVIEAILRLWMPIPDFISLPPNRYVPSRFPANARQVMTPDPTNLPGTRSPVVFSTNALGLRTTAPLTMPKPAGVRRVMFLGGSTTECLFLDDAETWPALVGRRLEGAADHRRVEDVNSGKSGQTTRDHLATLAQYLIPLGPDLVVIMAGVNDLWLQIYTDDYSPLRLDARSAMTLDTVLPWDYPLNALQVGRALVWTWRGWSSIDHLGNPIQDPSGTYIPRQRERRRTLPYRSIDPSRMQPNPEFEQNMRSLIGMAKANRIPVVLVTQHWLLSAQMSEEDKAQIWGSGADPSVRRRAGGSTARSVQRRHPPAGRGVWRGARRSGARSAQGSPAVLRRSARQHLRRATVRGTRRGRRRAVAAVT